MGSGISSGDSWCYEKVRDQERRAKPGFPGKSLRRVVGFGAGNRTREVAGGDAARADQARLTRKGAEAGATHSPSPARARATSSRKQRLDARQKHSLPAPETSHPGFVKCTPQHRKFNADSIKALRQMRSSTSRIKRKLYACPQRISKLLRRAAGVELLSNGRPFACVSFARQRRHAAGGNRERNRSKIEVR